MTCCPSELHDTERLFKACFGQLLWLTTWPASMCGRPCSSLSRTSTHPASSSCVLKALVVGLFARVDISVPKCKRIVWWCSCYPNYALTGRINSIYCYGSKRHQACCCPHLCFFARVSRYMSTWMYTWHFWFLSCSCCMNSCIDLCTSVCIFACLRQRSFIVWCWSSRTCNPCKHILHAWCHPWYFAPTKQGKEPWIYLSPGSIMTFDPSTNIVT